MNNLQKNSKHGLVNFRNVFLICALALLFMSGCSTAIFVGFSDDQIIKQQILKTGSVFFSLIFAVICAMYLFIIRPMNRLQKALDEAVSTGDDKLIKTMKHSLILSPIFSSLQSIVDRLENLTLRESNAQLMKKQAELDALQSQINPHFLYNTLDTLRGQAYLAGQHNIEAMSLALSKLFRYSISSYDSLVTLKEELSAVENYFLIQNFRFDNKFIKKYEVDEDTLQHKVPKMLIQPLVENAILHGLEPKAGKGTVIIKAYKTESFLVISIDDDGIGIEASRLTEINDALANNLQTKIKKKTRTSIGLYNINSRIRLLFGTEHHISLASNEGIGTTINISIPLV